MLKRGFKNFLLVLLFVCMVSLNVNAKETKVITGNMIEYISPTEMFGLIEKIERGEEISTRNIGVSYIKMTVMREGASCKVVFLNTSRLDPVNSITGTLRLANASGQIVASQAVNEKQLLYGVARVCYIYPMGGNFSKLLYNLLITEDAIVTPNIGEITL